MFRTGRNVGYFIILTAIQLSSQSQDPERLLLKLIGHRKPLVVYIEPRVKSHNVVDHLISEHREEFDDLLESGEDDPVSQSMERSAKEGAKYLFYQYLSKHSDNQQSDSSSKDDTKLALRQALRSRCMKVKKCVTQCVIDQYSCPSTCKKTIDKTNLCDPPKPKCKKSRCGKTMPPAWLL